MAEDQFRKYLKFTWMNRLRWWYWRGKLGHLGKRVNIDRNVRLLRFPRNISVADNAVLKEGARICSCNEKAKVSIGRNTTIGYHTFIFASEGIEIGDDCLIAPFVYIVDSNHRSRRGEKINRQGNETAPIKIGNDVWIASGVTIGKGVTIGDGAVIASGAFVIRDVEPYAIVGGAPAKKVGVRT